MMEISVDVIESDPSMELSITFSDGFNEFYLVRASGVVFKRVPKDDVVSFEKSSAGTS